MTLSHTVRMSLRLMALALGLVLLAVPALRAADSAPALPVTTSFEKVTGAEGAPYVLTIKNTSQDTLTVTAKVLLSVTFHAENKARNLPAQGIDAGKEWKISDLSADDKVILSAPGFATLEVTVP
jgi:hypothetical protein